MTYDRVSSGASRLPLGWYAVLRWSSSKQLGGALQAISVTPFPSKGAAEKAALIAVKAKRALMRRHAETR